VFHHVTKSSINQRARESSPSFRKSQDSPWHPSKILLWVWDKKTTVEVLPRIVGLFDEKHPKDVTQDLFLLLSMYEKRIHERVQLVLPKKTIGLAPKI
jgi:hypothetical protein